MQNVFIGGIPASGKSYLAEKIARTTGALHVKIDAWRDEMAIDPKLEYWVNFFWNLNEEEYWRTATCDEQWGNIQKQSEAFWPTILRRIKETQKTGKPAIFESVNILPHLASRDLNFGGVFLLGESFEEIFERNKREPRWGKTEELQRKEAEAFFGCERSMYKSEAEKYGFKTFTNSRDAEGALLNL